MKQCTECGREIYFNKKYCGECKEAIHSEKEINRTVIGKRVAPPTITTLEDREVETQEAHFNLMCETVKECLLPIKSVMKKSEIQKRRRKFIKSKIVKVWADCSNLDYEKLKKVIIKFNTWD